MTMRVVARIRPQQQSELDQDVIVSTGVNENPTAQATLVKIPNSKNNSEHFTFNFTAVYDGAASQQLIFENEGQCN